MIKIIHFGDSLTECPGVKEEMNWVSLWGRKLQGSLGKSVPLKIINRGKTGRNTRQALEAMPGEVQSEPPDLLTLQFGANDSVYWESNRGEPIVSGPAFRANLVEMARRARRIGVKKIFFVTNHRFLKNVVEPNGKTRNQNAEDYNQMVREVAQAENCGLIDLNRLLSSQDSEEYVFPMPDGVHLNPRGCELYAEMFHQSLYPHIKEMAVSLCSK